MNAAKLFRSLVLATIPCFGIASGAAGDAAVESSGTEQAGRESPGSQRSSPSPRVEWGATYASKYAFQGLDYSEGGPVLQPELAGRIAPLSARVWVNLDQRYRRLDEIDANVQGEWERGPFAGAVGCMHLRYPHRAGWSPTYELFADLALDAAMQPAVSVHWDIDEGNGRYWTFGLSHELAASDLSVALLAEIYVQDGYYGMTGIPAVETGVTVAGGWAGVLFEPSLSRLWAWENGSFHGSDAVASDWLLGLSVSGR